MPSQVIASYQSIRPPNGSQLVIGNGTPHLPGSAPVVLPDFALTLTLADAAHGVSLSWWTSCQLLAPDGGGAGFVAYLMRGGILLGMGCPMWSLAGQQMGVIGCSPVNDLPGYIGPLTYVIGVIPIVGTCQIPANFGAQAMISADEVALS